jgi:hypothetical protein
VYFGDRLFTALYVAAHDHNMNAQLDQFVGYGTTNTTCSSCNECGCSHFLYPPHVSPDAEESLRLYSVRADIVAKVFLHW